MEWVDDPNPPKLKRLEDSMYRIAHWDERFAKLDLDDALKSVNVGV
jgi:hypothetical protein